MATRCASQHPHLSHHRPFGVGAAEVEDTTSLHGASLPGWEMLGEKPWKNMGKTENESMEKSSLRIRKISVLHS